LLLYFPSPSIFPFENVPLKVHYFLMRSLWEPRYFGRYSDGLRAGRSGFDFRQCMIFLFSRNVQTGIGV
jgi:hypothetical protein